MRMDNSWEIIKLLLQYAFAPLAAFLVWTYKKQHNRVDKLEYRVGEVEKSTAVTQVMIDNIREDIREIKHGISKLVDRS